MQLLLQQQGVRAKRNELLLGDETPDDIADLAVDQRLAAGDGHHRRAALVSGIEALFDGEPPIENWIGIVDLAATDASQIATKQRLQHEDKWITFAPQELLLEDVSANAHFLEKRLSHSLYVPVCRLNGLINASARRKFAG